MSNKLRIRGMLLHDYKELRNISKNKDMTFQLFMRQLLREIADECEEEEGAHIEIEYKNDIRLYGISPKTYDAITKHCLKIDVPVSTFLKIEMNRIKSRYPNALKERPFGD